MCYFLRIYAKTAVSVSKLLKNRSYSERKVFMKAYTPENMRMADSFAIEKLGIPGITLMDRAADALYNALSEYLFKNRRFVILCGKGNNGGDGWALAKKLSDSFEKVVCISLFGKPVTSDAQHFCGMCESPINSASAIKIIHCQESFAEAEEAVSSADVIVDAVFGTGFSGEIEKDSFTSRLFELANDKDAFRLSADVPSGIDALLGTASESTFKADVTVTFAKLKAGMLSYPANSYCGKIIVADIGIPESVFDSFNSQYEVTDDTLIREYIPKRYADSNKGSYGKLLVFAGSKNMTGAAHLALSGALRTGVGLVAFASDPYVTDVTKHRLSEPVFMPISDLDDDTDALIEYCKNCSAVLIGCGIGTNENTKKRVIRMIKECSCPIILDADGINTVSDNINVITEAKSEILLTPHPLEFSRISGKSVSDISKNRLGVALEFSKKYNCCLLLKGAGTVICNKGEKVCINPISCSALSKGGSGDVLAGIIASFTAQGASLYESAVIGAYLHAIAGKELSKEYSEYGVMPSDIPEKVARILAVLL